MDKETHMAPFVAFDGGSGYMGGIGVRDHIPDERNEENHKRNAFKKRRAREAAAKKARRRNRK